MADIIFLLLGVGFFAGALQNVMGRESTPLSL